MNKKQIEKYNNLMDENTKIRKELIQLRLEKDKKIRELKEHNKELQKLANTWNKTHIEIEKQTAKESLKLLEKAYKPAKDYGKCKICMFKKVCDNWNSPVAFCEGIEESMFWLKNEIKNRFLK